MTNDKGVTFMRAAVPELERVCVITQWGWKRPHIHQPGKDIVVPPVLNATVLTAGSPLLKAPSSQAQPFMNATSVRPTYLLSFMGQVRPRDRGYSFGVRQQIFRLYGNRSDCYLRDVSNADSKSQSHNEYSSIMRASKFCLAPSGMGFSTRVHEAIAMGCVPLIIQDEPQTNSDVEQAFESVLPYANFSLRLRQSDIARLPEILNALSDEHWHALRRGIACVWPRVLWLQDEQHAYGGATSPLSTLRSVDAFETLIEVLKKRLLTRRRPGSSRTDRAPSPPPFDWRTHVESCSPVVGVPFSRSR